MLLSIVIPTKNRPDYLKKILRSFYEQSLQESNYEIIVVDDCSKNKNLIQNREITKTYNAILIEHKKTQGSGGARNSGIEKAKGKWIAFLDDDVTPNKNWLINVFDKIIKIKDDIIGIEGMVVCKGDGLWDKEVENLYGNLYLTANIIYKKDAILNAGLFNKNFLKYGEDQEFALRIKKLGDICFDSCIEVTHLPRNISFKSIILDSFDRIQSLLKSEYLLYQIHPEDYCTIRYADTFWKTLKNSIIKHSVISIKRRSLKHLISKPFQLIYLLISLLLEHLAVILFAPSFIIEELNKKIQIPKSIDISKTAAINNITKSETVELLNNGNTFKNNLKRIVSGKRNYKNFYHQLNRFSKREQPNILLRIDDIFLIERKTISQLCTILLDNQVSFLAAITLNDLKNPINQDIIKTIKNAGGTIAMHGISHEGKHGFFPSEILQMNQNTLLEILNENKKIDSKFFIPPFNAITWYQIETLSNGFSVICGGPETGRFTQHISLPVILNSNCLYLPSLPPYYNSSTNILKNDKYLIQKGLLPITLHLNIEKADNFNSLNILIKRYKKSFLNWDSILMEITDG